MSDQIVEMKNKLVTKAKKALVASIKGLVVQTIFKEVIPKSNRKKE